MNPTHFSISEIIHANGESIYKLIFGDNYLRCSESHCLFDNNSSAFKHAYELNVGDAIKTSNGNILIEKIEIEKAEPVIGLVLKDNGCYFANNLLSHSQNTHPSFITNRIQNESNSIIESAVKNYADSSVACVAYGTQIHFSPNETKNVESFEIGDNVFGLVSENEEAIFTVLEKQIVNNQVVYAIYTENNYLECSEYHNIFSFTENTFRHPWQLNKNDFVKTVNGIEVVEKVIAKGAQTVVSLKLSEPGTFFAGGILSHCESIPPNYDLALKQPPFNTYFKYLNIDSTKSDTISNAVMASREVALLSSCAVDSECLIKTEKGDVKANKIKKKTRVYGLDSQGQDALFIVENIIELIQDCVEIVFDDNSAITLSKNCPIFSETKHTFVQSFRLCKDEEIKLDNCIKTVKTLNSIKANSISITLNEGNFFANQVLIHNQDVLSDYAHSQIIVNNVSEISVSEINKVIKPSMKEILPLWKYKNSEEWKKAFYLLDFNLKEEDAGYSFGPKNLLVRMELDINNHSSEIIMLKLLGNEIKTQINFNNLDISDEAQFFNFNDITIGFITLNRLSSSSIKSIFDFDFSCDNIGLLTNFNLINSDEHQAILEYFQGYKG